ncbi:MAG: KH domain-containing protein [Ignavibacteriaceae bacterium]|nr:KH domain-containing protein [Ignavibacteriaceae bacterium]
MKEFVEFIVKQLVDKPDKVSVEEILPNENTYEIKIKVDQSDIGKVVGKKGKNIDALRTLLTAVAAKERHRVTLQVLD